MNEPSFHQMKATRERVHGNCLVCNQPHESALDLKFQVRPDGSIVGNFTGRDIFEGYNGLLHGGIISSIMDGAMTNCLFAHGIVAVTADLNVRFRHPVELLVPLEVTAMIVRNTGPLFSLEAKLTQGGMLKAKAAAKFMEAPAPLAKKIEESSYQQEVE